MRRNWRLILGPPGTGKTTTLLGHLEGELAATEPERIAFVTFTRAARADARGRAAYVAGDDRRLLWFRTVHSTAHRLLGLERGDVLDEKDWKAFADQHGYDLSAQTVREDDDFSNAPTAEDDDLLSTYSWARSRRMGLADAASQSPFDPSLRRLELFAKRLERFKRECGKYDFHDMLEGALKLPDRRFVDIAFVDEAQDLSPLQVALCEKWFRGCGRVYVAGDDDQAIMAFQGGDPDWLLRLSKECGRVDVLSKSYRVPATVHAVAQEIVTGNQNRVSKRYSPRDDEGQVDVVFSFRDAAAKISDDENTFVLARNWKFLRECAQELAEMGKIFRAERHDGWSPMGRPTVMEALRGALDLKNGHKISTKRLSRLLDQIPTKNYLPRGVKKRAKELDGFVSRGELDRWGMGKILRAIDKDPVSVLIKVEKDRRTALSQILKRNNGRIPRAKIVLTSIHASKGREADTVIILSDMGKLSFDEYDGSRSGKEAENRVAYVGVTRAKKRLIVVHSESLESYPYAAAVENSRQHKSEISADEAKGILARRPRYHFAATKKVVETWYSLVRRSKDRELWLESKRFDALFKALQREGFPRIDAGWVAYLWVSQISRQQNCRPGETPKRRPPSEGGSPSTSPA